MIVTRSLTKRFGDLLAVDQVDLDVRDGDRYGFLGPNGSGKTTLIRMLLGLVYATSGEIELMGKPMPGRAAEVLPEIGAMVEGPSAYGHLSGRANLALIDAAGRAGARRTRRARVAEALERAGLAGIDNRPVKRYSLGMRQRLGLAAALLRTPRLLVLDEPTNGLDPQGIREVRDLLIELNKAGTTVFLSSHQLAEVDQLCTRVGVIDRGRLVVQEDLEELRGPTGRVIVRSPDADRAVAMLDGRVERIEGDTLLVAEADSAALNLRLVAAGVRVTEIGPERRSLEKLVLAVTGSGSDRIDRAGDGAGDHAGGDAGRGADDHAGGGQDAGPAPGGHGGVRLADGGAVDHAGSGAGRGADDHAGDGTAQAEGGDPGDPG
jgi:ABC-type multidrug transport system ATPase subunit